MGRGTAKIVLDKNTVSRLAKRILKRYYLTLENKSAKELLDETVTFDSSATSANIHLVVETATGATGVGCA